MIFLHPIWLVALAALSVPLAIHLWNIARGRTLKVGSISLASASSQKRSISRRVNELLLLLLRCLLLAALALVLTMPFLQRTPGSSKIKGWILIPRREIKESYREFRPRIDSLIAAGYEFHYFNKGFAKAEWARALLEPAKYPSGADSYWDLIQQLNTSIPPSLPVYVFTSNRVTHFSGEKPQVALRLHWQTYTPRDSLSSWIEKAWLGEDNQIHAVRGSSNPEGISYSSYSLSSAPGRAPFVLRGAGSRLSVGLKGSAQMLAADTAAWHFAIFARENTSDARYLEAALQAIAGFAKHKAVIRRYSDAGAIKGHQNWIFWLSAIPVIRDMNSDNLLSYEIGKVTSSSSWIIGQEPVMQKISLYRLVEAAPKGFTLWKDGFGNPVLSIQGQSKMNRYHFYSRFDPAWSGLVWSNQFPAMLLKLITGASAAPADAGLDKRALSQQQSMPSVTAEAEVRGANTSAGLDLTHYAGLLLAALLAAERWLAHRISARQTPQNV